MTTTTQPPTAPIRLPEWFRQSRGKRQAAVKLSSMLDTDIPNSICHEARCPNRSECWSKGVLTFMIMGTTCTRNCGFCSVAHGKPPEAPDPNEAQTIVNAINKLGLRFVVLTSPNRDDLPDGGSGHYAHIVRAIKTHYPQVKVEVLIPDMKGDPMALKTVVDAHPDVINHNMETVSELYRIVRRGSLYTRSLALLKKIKDYNPTMLTKTGFMVGLGETEDQLMQAFRDARDAGVDMITIGQYLKPTRDNLDVIRYYHPDEFISLKAKAESLGIRHVFSGPLVRSSYMAEHVFDDVVAYD